MGKKENKLRILDDEQIEAEIVYIGGGNAMVILRDKEVFQSVCQNLGIRVATKLSRALSGCCICCGHSVTEL